MKYRVAERFRSLQGEGIYTGTPMAFVRLVGCSVGKKICSFCDTDFDVTMPWRGGGEYSARDIMDWAFPYKHVCLTGGEPLDQDLLPFFDPDLRADSTALRGHIPDMVHIETSGTKPIPDSWSDYRRRSSGAVSLDNLLWICVSPKPGFIEEVVMQADEVKVIVPGLGSDTSLRLLEKDIPAPPMGGRKLYWPTLTDALRWAEAGKIVFLQPRNEKNVVNQVNLMYVLDVLKDHPNLRLSTQMHKILHVQ